MRFVQIDLIAKDWKRVARFYQDVFGCTPVLPKRDWKDEVLSILTGIEGAHKTGIRLALPGYGDNPPVLEIVSYNETIETETTCSVRAFSHITFEAADIYGILDTILAAGGSSVGGVVRTAYPDGREARFAYAKDVEGNLIRLECFPKTIAKTMLLEADK